MKVVLTSTRVLVVSYILVYILTCMCVVGEVCVQCVCVCECACVCWCGCRCRCVCVCWCVEGGAGVCARTYYIAIAVLVCGRVPHTSPRVKLARIGGPGHRTRSARPTSSPLHGLSNPFYRDVVPDNPQRILHTAETEAARGACELDD